MEIDKIKELIHAVSNSGLTDFDYEEGNMKIHLEKHPERNTQTVAVTALPGVTAMPEAQPATETVSEEKEGFIVESPLVGTYYQAPAKDAPPFVKVGDTVKKGDVLAIVEAMKLMNEIESEVDGTIAEIYMSDEDAVEYGQPLFRII